MTMTTTTAATKRARKSHRLRSSSSPRPRHTITTEFSGEPANKKSKQTVQTYERDIDSPSLVLLKSVLIGLVGQRNCSNY